MNCLRGNEMNKRNFALSFVFFLLLITPFYLQAGSPGSEKEAKLLSTVKKENVCMTNNKDMGNK